MIFVDRLASGRFHRPLNTVRQKLRLWESLPSTDERLGDDLKNRTRRNFDKSCEISLRHARRSLRDVRGYRNRSASHLIRQAKSFLRWKMARLIVNQVRESNRLLPNV